MQTEKDRQLAVSKWKIMVTWKMVVMVVMKNRQLIEIFLNDIGKY